MKRRLLCLMPALVMALLTGCALAQPVRESAGADRWVGYYMVDVYKRQTWNRAPCTGGRTRGEHRLHEHNRKQGKPTFS